MHTHVIRFRKDLLCGVEQTRSTAIECTCTPLQEDQQQDDDRGNDEDCSYDTHDQNPMILDPVPMVLAQLSDVRPVTDDQIYDQNQDCRNEDHREHNPDLDVDPIKHSSPFHGRSFAESLSEGSKEEDQECDGYAEEYL